MRDHFKYEPWQEPGYVEDRDGRLWFDGVDTLALAVEYGTPLYVYSERKILETARRIHDGFAAQHPDVCVAYASKACNLDGILRVIRKAGIAIEVNSKGELTKARRAGFPDSDIVLNGVAKSREELAAAMSPAIKAINVDSPFELQRIADVARDADLKANVALRLVPELESGTAPGIETASSATKFGMTEHDFEACLPILDQAKDRVHLAGLHVHIGSQITERSSYSEAGRFIAAKAALAEGIVGHALDHINVGGGFPGNYVKYNDQSPEIGPYRSDMTPAEVASAVVPPILAALDGGRQIVIEPGRSMVVNAAILLSTVENVKRRPRAGEMDDWLYLDAGYHTLLEAFVYRWYFHMVTANRTAETETGLFRVVGPLCDNGDSFYDVEGEGTLKRLLETEPGLQPFADTLRRHLVHMPGYRELPAATAADDIVAFLDCGAYSQDQIFALNGRGRPAVLLIEESGAVRMIRRADSEEDQALNEVS